MAEAGKFGTTQIHSTAGSPNIIKLLLTRKNTPNSYTHQSPGEQRSRFPCQGRNCALFFPGDDRFHPLTLSMW